MGILAAAPTAFDAVAAGYNETGLPGEGLGGCGGGGRRSGRGRLCTQGRTRRRSSGRRGVSIVEPSYAGTLHRPVADRGEVFNALYQHAAGFRKAVSEFRVEIGGHNWVKIRQHRLDAFTPIIGGNLGG